MAGPRVNNTQARLVAFDKNAPLASNQVGGGDIRTFRGTPSLRDYINEKNRQKEKERKKNEEQGGEDKAWYYLSGGEIQPQVTQTEESYEKYKKYDPPKVVIGKGEPGTNGEGWRLFTLWDIFAGQENTYPFKIINVSDQHTIKLPTNPLENGMIKHDHKVIMPATLRVTGYVYRDESVRFSQELKKYLGATDLMWYFILRSPWKYFPRMYLKGFTSRANNQRYDVYEYTLDLTELLIARSIIDKTNNPNLASTSNNGAQGPKS